MAPDGHACATSTTRSTGMASGWIQGPFTLARKTLGVQVTQKREWMQRRPSKSSSSLAPCTRSTPSATAAAAGPGMAEAAGEDEDAATAGERAAGEVVTTGAAAGDPAAAGADRSNSRAARV